ncbi:MAG TPA: sugar ABC transporter ATP-binding protein [Acidobacteriota bacterium]|nr:sugar ABC transporter ATP-binding protein [Acidobacteriota bacterium]
MQNKDGIDRTNSRVPLLQMRGITKTFPGVRALDGVDLEVGRGEIVALVGENGAGKSTLLNILGGVHQPDSGRILMDGREVAIGSVSEAIRLGIGFIHQELNLLENLDIAGNIFLGRETTRGGFVKLLDREEMERQSSGWLEKVGLRLHPATSLNRLSMGQKQMVEIAKALSQQARILIMDEPTSSLTVAETNRLLALAEELRARGVAVVYVSHRLGEVERIAERAFVLRDGSCVGTLEGASITHDRMVSLMVGRKLQVPSGVSRSRRGQPLLRISNLRTRSRPEVSVELTLHTGEILGLAGLIGSGRTDLARAIFGIESALSGEVRLRGEKLQIRHPVDAVRAGLYLVPEDRRDVGLVLPLSVRENLSLPNLKSLSRHGLVRLERESRYGLELCRRLNVRRSSLEGRAAVLSGGNQQKIALAKWLGRDPQVLILDEPTRGVDVGARSEIYRLARELVERGLGVLWIGSEMEELIRICDRIAVMHEGVISGCLEPEEFCEEKILRLAVGPARRSSPPQPPAEFLS